MIPLVEFPELVEHYAPCFERVFSAEAFIEFKRYISGLIVSENKTVDGINRLVVHESRNQSSLNRLLTESPFSLKALNQARLQMLASLERTKLKRKGVLALDDTLLEHYGQAFEKIAKLFDHVTQTYVWAHDLVTVHYSDDDTDYPAVFQLWEPAEVEKVEAGLRAAGITLKASKESLRESAPDKWRGYVMGVWQRQQKKHKELRELYDTKLTMAEKMLTEWFQEHPELDLPITFDSWFTQPPFCQYVDQVLHRAYVGTLDGTDKILLKSGETTLEAFAQHLKEEHLEAVAKQKKPVFQRLTIFFKGEHETYYSYCQTHHLCGFKRQRLVINYRQADLSDKPTFFISNRLVWNATGITRIRRHRWPVEVYHEEGKAEGLDQYQLRSFDAIQRHVAMVAAVYSILRAAQHDHDLHIKLQRILKINLEGTPAAERRAAQAQILWCVGEYIRTGLENGLSLHKILDPLIRSMCGA